MKALGTLAALGLISLATATACAEEWPKWLGPDGSGISTEKIATAWPAGGPKKVWSSEVGLGFSTIVALDEKIYAFGQKGDQDALTALDAETGKTLWTQSYTVTHKADKPQGANPANNLPLPEASPTIDGDRIYTYGGGGDLICRKLADGSELWKLNILDATGGRILQWDASSAPLVTDKFVYVQGGQDAAVAVAVDKTTGKIVWKSATGLGGYAAPILITVESVPQLIVFGGNTLYALNPATGATLWSYPWQTQYDVNATTPVYRDGYLFISSSYGHGCAMLEVHANSVKLDWKGKQLGSKFQPCILKGDALIGNSDGRLKCLAWPTNKVLWSSNQVELGQGGSIVIDDAQLIALSEKGKLSLVQLSAAGAEVKSEVDLFEGDNIWSSPVIYHGKLYAKGKTELVCLDIRGK